jgi:exosortase E/protease (VPEID-CTERM system)
LLGITVQANDELPPASSSGAVSINLARSWFTTERRVVLLLFVIACQIVILKFDTHFSSDLYYLGLSVPGGTFTSITYFALGFFLLLSTHFSRVWSDLIRYATDHIWWRLIVPQLALYLLIFYSTSNLLHHPSTAIHHVKGFDAGWRIVQAASLLFTSILSLGLIAPTAYWVQFIRREKTTFLLALIFPAGYAFFYYLAEHSLDVLGGPTFNAVTFLLGFIYRDIQTDPDLAIVGTGNFIVIIDQLCAGYEGIGMMSLFLIWYLRTFRGELKFPVSLLLFPIGIALIWMFNCLRLVLLVSIGSSVSPDIALQGFHANAGWILFISGSLLMVAIAKKCPLFSKAVTEPVFVIDSCNALAIPFLVMLAATLFSSAFSTDFPWLYPIRAIATGLAIFLLWKHADIQVITPRLFPVLAGVLVFPIWLALVPPSVAADKDFSEHLHSVPIFLATGWILIRLLASVIIIPIAEEFAFRGYLVSFFTNADKEARSLGKIRWAPFIISSILFGALHSFWIAGTIAGAVYYLVKQRSGRLWDAVVAHMTTNLLLSVYVLISRHWSYW